MRMKFGVYDFTKSTSDSVKHKTHQTRRKTKSAGAMPAVQGAAVKEVKRNAYAPRYRK
jgi:hypothetical protein